MPAVLVVLSFAPLLLLAAPVFCLVWRSSSRAQWAAALADETVSQALWLSGETTLAALVLIVLFGTPLAYLLSRYRFPGRGLVDTLVDLPVVLPPAVAGVALLMAFGRRGVLGPAIEASGLEIAFSTTGVVIAQCFVAAPFYIRSARTGFDHVDPQLELVAASLGASRFAVFRRVTLRLALPTLVAGIVMSGARALGEFGATLMFAGNFPGRTQTMPLAIYTAMESDMGVALTISCVLLAVSFLALFALRASRREVPHAP